MYKCPVCGSQMELLIKEYDIPHFGKSIIFSAICKNCGYKHSDVFSVERKNPIKLIFRAEKEEDLIVRVIKSSEASIEIPELGIRIDPGIMSQGYITNVEGILLRVEEVLKGQLVVEKELEKRKKILELLKDIDAMRKGIKQFTLIIEDPSGNSFIDSPKVEKLKYQVKETEI